MGKQVRDEKKIDTIMKMQQTHDVALKEIIPDIIAFRQRSHDGYGYGQIGYDAASPRQHDNTTYQYENGNDEYGYGSYNDGTGAHSCQNDPFVDAAGRNSQKPTIHLKLQ